MTATMIGSLVEEGKLSWKSTFKEIFPESADQFHPQFQEAKLSHLLTHRAGLPHDGPWWRLPGQTTTQARHALLDEHAATSTALQARVNLRLLERRLRAGRPHGRAGDGRILGKLDDQAPVRAAGNVFRGVWHAGATGAVTEPWGHRLEGRDVKPSQHDNAPSLGPAGTSTARFRIGRSLPRSIWRASTIAPNY